MSTTASTLMMLNHNNNNADDDQYTAAAAAAIRLNSNTRIVMQTTNVNDRRQNEREREKVTSPFANEQYNNCPNVTHTMANYLSSSERHKIFRSNHRSYEPSYPSITRFRTLFSTSPFRKTHYLDDSDEEIIDDEILEMIDLDHYPTLEELWGDDTKPRIRQEGEYKIEDYIEFEEIEPTITEEISYEIVYQGNQIKSTREIRHSRSESRNFRRIKKRRTRRKRTTRCSHIDDSSNENMIPKKTYAIPPTIINRIPSTNIDLIDQNISSQTFQPNDQQRTDFHLIEHEINPSHLSNNDVSSRMVSSINESNDKHVQITTNETSLISIDSEIKHQETSVQTNDDDRDNSLIDNQSLIQNERKTTTINEQPISPVESFSSVQSKETTAVDDIPTTVSHLELSSKIEDEEKQSTSDTSVNILLPSVETKTEIVRPGELDDKKSGHHLPTEVDKQLETISTPARTTTIILEEAPCQRTDFIGNESIINNSANGTATKIAFDKQQQQSPKTEEEDGDVEPSLEFLADIVRQITAALAPIQLPFINPTDTEGLESINAATSEDLLSDELSEAILSTAQSIFHLNQSLSSATDSDPATNSESWMQSNISSQLERSSSTDTIQSSYSLFDLSTDINTTPTAPLSENLIHTSQHLERNEQTSSKDFSDFYYDRFLPSTTNEQTLSNYFPIENDALEEKNTNTDLTKIYYELLERRHIQPGLEHTQTESKQETSNNQEVNLDIGSFSIVTNLPTWEYRQVFGVSDEIIHTVNDLTYHVDQTLQGNSSNEEVLTRETSKDDQSIVSTAEENLVNEAPPNLTSNAELDSRYSLLLDRMNVLLKPLIDLSSASLATETKPTPSNIDEEQNSSNIINHDKIFVPFEESAVRAEENELVTIVVSKFTNALPTSEPIDETNTSVESIHDKYESPIITNEEIRTEEDDNQQQSSSIGLLDILKSFIPATLLPTTPLDTSLDTIQSDVTNEQQDTVAALHDDINLTTIDANQSPLLQASTENEKQSHGILDLVGNAISNIKETILHLAASDEKTIEPIDMADTLDNTAQKSEDLGNNREQLTNIKTVEENNQNTDEEKVSTEESFTVVDTEPAGSSTVHQSSTIDHEQENQNEKKPSQQQLQVINDDYPWYASYYSIVDAEARFARLHKQLNLSNEQLPLPAKVELEKRLPEKIITQNKELEDEQDNDDNGFQIVQRRKRIPSSTTHEKAMSSSIGASKIPLSSDIDLKPVVLHGHAAATIPISPIVPQTTEVTTKKKRKKSKKDNKERLLFDAPEPTINPTHPQTVEDEHVHSTSTITSANQQAEIVSNQQESIDIDDQKNTSTSSAPSLSPSTTATALQEDVPDGPLSIKQPPIPTVFSNFTNAPPSSESIEETKTSIELVHAEPESPIVINEEMRTKEDDDNQQQSSSVGLLDIVKNFIQATVLPTTPVETSSETIQSNLTTEREQNIVEELHADINLTTTNINQPTLLQASTENEKESHGILDLVGSALSNIKETILHLAASHDKTTEPIDVFGKLDDHIQQSGDLSDNKEPLTNIELVEKVIQNMDEGKVSTEESFTVVDTESAGLSTVHQSSTIDHEQENQNEKKPSQQQLQVINDDYPWYSSYYSIVDAEARFARLHKQLHLSNEQLPLPAKVELEKKSPENITTQNKELEDEQDNDDNGFQIVQRRKRIPSSTTHEKAMSSSIDTSKLPLSSDIDLKPVILHGHAAATIPISPIVSQTTEVTTKKKRKKSKKDNKELVLFDAPEPTINPTHPQTVEDEQVHSTSTITSAYRKPEIISNEQELIDIDDQKHTLTPSAPSLSPTTPVTALAEDVIDGSLSIEQPPITTVVSNFIDTIPSSEPVEETKTSIELVPAEPESPIVDVTAEQQDTAEAIHDDINLTTTNTNQPTLLQASTENEKESHGILDLVGSAISNIKDAILHLAASDDKTTEPIDVFGKLDDHIQQSEDLSDNKEQQTNIETVESFTVVDTESAGLSTVHQSSLIDHEQENQNVERPSHQQLQVIDDDYPWYPSYYSIVDAEARFARLHKQLNLSNQQLPLPAKVELEPRLPENITTQNKELEDEQDNDDNGFLIVQRRKRIPSSTTHEKAMSSSIGASKIPLSSDIDLKPVVLHGHAAATIPISPIVPQTTEVTTKKKRKKSKKDNKERLLFDAPEPTINPTHPQTVEDEHVHSTSTITSANQQAEIVSNQQESIDIDDQKNTSTSSAPSLSPSTTATALQEDVPDGPLSIKQPPVPTVFSNFTNAPPSSESIEETKTSIELVPAEPESPIVTDERIGIQEVVSKTPVETSLKSIQSDVTNEQQDTLDELHDDINLITTDANQSALLQASTENEQESHGILDLVGSAFSNIKETILHLAASDEKTAEPIDVSATLDDHIHQSEDLDNEKEELTNIEATEELNQNLDELPLPAKVELEKKASESITTQNKELEDEQNNDGNGFQIVQRRKRIPSSTTHEKTMSSSIDTTKPPLSPDIDLKPIIFHGHAAATIPISPIVSQTTDVTSKKKRKKPKKKDNKEMVLFDAPEATMSPTHSQTVEDEQLHSTSTASFAYQKSEIVSNEQDSIEIDDQKNALTSSAPSSLPPTRVATFPEDVPDSLLSIEQSPTEEESLIQSAPSPIKPTTAITKTNVTRSSKNEQEEEDNEGFQVVRYRGRILSTTKPELTPPSTPTSHVVFNPDFDQKAPVSPEQQNSPAPKNKRNKHKKQKKEDDSSSSVDSNKVEQEITSQPDEAPSPSQSTIPSTIAAKTTHPKPSVALEDEDEDDNEGFQVVTYRKRITSAPRFANIPTSPSTKTRSERHVNRNIDPRHVAFHGRHESASPSVPHTTTNTKTTANQNVPLRAKQDKKQISLFNTPPRSISAETQMITSTGASSNSRTPKDGKQKIERSPPTPVGHQQRVKDSSIEEVAPPSTSSVVNTNVEKSTSENDQNRLSPSTLSLELLIPQGATHKKKPESNKENTGSSLTTDLALTPLSVEETINRKATDGTPQLHGPQITSVNTSNADEASSINTTSNTTTSPIIESTHPENDPQTQCHSIQSIASTTSAIEEVSKSSNDPVNKVDDHSITQQIEKEELTQEPLPTVPLQSTITTEDEHLQVTPVKKPAKRRKKKLHAKEQPDDEVVLTSSTNATAAISSLPKSNAIETTTIPSTHIVSKEVSNKLDLFLPEYIREQINTSETSSSSSSKTTSSDIIPKKKSRSKLLTKDHEAKSLLTNEFDHQILHTDKQDIQQITSPTDESIHSTTTSSKSEENNSTAPSVDDILSRGFYLWLQESQAISQQQDDLTPIMQSIVIQPSAIIDEDDEEDSWNTLKPSKSSYMIGFQPHKQIHTTNAYSINHPESTTSTPSWLIAQSHDSTFPDQFNSDHDDDSKNSTYTQPNSSHIHHQPTNSTTQGYSGGNLSRPLDQNSSLKFDNWAHFSEDKTIYQIGHDFSTPLEYFYTQPFDEDTFISDAIPNEHSMQSKRQRYGDFLPSNNDQSNTSRPFCKIKPSESFQTWQKYKQTDDEILISHSPDGLSRRVRS